MPAEQEPQQPNPDGKPDPKPEPPAEPKAPDELAQTKQALHQANREAAEMRRKLQKFEDADKSAEERATSAQQRAESAELEAARWRAAHEAGVPSKDVKRLSGSTYEELLADAKEFMEGREPAGQTPPPPAGRPRPAGGVPLNGASQGKARAVEALREFRNTQ